MGFMDSLKGLADKVGDTVEKGVKTGSDGYKKMTEKARIKKEITQAESAIQDAYVEIGKKFAAENPEAEGFMDFFKAIADSTAKIEDKITCKGCGASVDKNAKFCAKCGTKVEIEVPAETVAEEAEKAEAPAEKKVCSNCGAELAEGAKFCEKCGTENE